MKNKKMRRFISWGFLLGLVLIAIGAGINSPARGFVVGGIELTVWAVFAIAGLDKRENGDE